MVEWYVMRIMLAESKYDNQTEYIIEMKVEEFEEHLKTNYSFIQ